ncbi:hypothetical protein HK100_008171 [Physocladia obscura]|uniref:IQ motif and ubiquitin-like domain-containing protein n=1 Tax=Physocladia obscura TaxID=109957 RepID=A0AAD5T716_9FUNG|nr:hypothetical protein HK100_008171 [Physocladia obscura]
MPDQKSIENRAASIIQQIWRKTSTKSSVESLNKDLEPEQSVAQVVAITPNKSSEAVMKLATNEIEELIPDSEKSENKLEGNSSSKIFESAPTEQLETNLELQPENSTTVDEFPDTSTWHKKVYMGGYRSKKNGAVYFNATSQTPTAQEIKDAKANPKFHRDTQTKFERHRFSQPKRESFTQMDKSDCFVSSVYDYAIRPKKYFSSEDHEKMLNHMATVIQCFVRKCFASRLVRRLRKERDMRMKAMAAKEKRRKALENKKRKKEIESRLHPKTRKDFDILYNGLEQPARLAALADLMDQEAVLIQKIDKLKIAANEENREKAIVKLLEKMSSPKRWPVLKGEGAVLVDTPNTIRARELRDLYHALTVSMLSVDERLQILLHVKYTVKEFDCVLTREIVELINREGDLVSRGRDIKSLEGLRRRISNLFLQFVQTPEFNPEAAAYQKFPDAGQSWKRDQAVYYCRSCTKYLPSTEFYLSTTMKHLGRCKPCTLAENIANQRQEDTGYADLLRNMRSEEVAKRAVVGTPADAHYNAIALLQEADMRHLVDVIWGKQSCISAAKNMDDLVLTRWDPKVELSPWNCIMLTRAEADKHELRSDPTMLYTDDFIRKIKQKHLAARRHFAQLPAMERYLKRHYFEDEEGRLILQQ